MNDSEIMQEADALEALEKRLDSSWYDRDYLIGVIRNRAMTLIRALRERVTQRNITLREAETNLEASEKARDSLENQLTRAQARIESLEAEVRAANFSLEKSVPRELAEVLEAERDIWRERAKSLCFWSTDHEPGKCTCVPPTPSEIAARIQQKKTEAKP